MKLPHIIERLTLPKKKIWHDTVRMLMRDDPVGAGEDGPTNIPLQELSDRTEYLKENMEAISEQVKAGFILSSSFEKGYTITLANEVLLYEADGQYYRWTGDLPKDVPENSTPMATGGIVGGAWVLVGDGALRSELANSNGSNMIGFNELTLTQALSTLPNTYTNEYDIFIIYGQSNAVGYAGLTTDMSGLVSIPDYSYYWKYTSSNNKGEFLKQSNFMRHASGDVSTGSAWNAFAREYIANTGRGVIFIPCAKGGMSISQLAKGSEYYTKMSASVDSFNNYKNNLGIKIGNIYALFNQGETDMTQNVSKSEYQNMLTALANQMITDFNIKTFYILLVGSPQTRLASTWQQIQLAQMTMSNSNASIKLATDIPAKFTISNGCLTNDKTHFSAKGYNLMGSDAAKNISKDILNQTSRTLIDISNNGKLILPNQCLWNFFNATIRVINNNWTILDRNSYSTGYFAASNTKSITTNGDQFLYLELNFLPKQDLSLNVSFDDGAVQKGWVISVRYTNLIQIGAAANMHGIIDLQNITIDATDPYLTAMFNIKFIEDDNGGYFQINHPASYSQMMFISSGTTTKGMVRPYRDNRAQTNFRRSDYTGRYLCFNLPSGLVDLPNYKGPDITINVNGIASEDFR